MDYRREIDGLRALAVVPVVLFHAGFAPFSGGYVGVDVFFVISGYLITSIILADLDQGRFRLATFYERRIRRILPPLFLVILVSLPFACAWLSLSFLRDYFQSVAAVSVFVSNILFWWESGYFEPAASLKPLLHTWSLSVEEQFYLLFPLCLILIWRFQKRAVWAAVSVTGLASLMLALVVATRWPEAGFFLAPTRAWELMLGAALACPSVQRRVDAIDGRIGAGLALLGLSMVVVVVFAYSEALPWPSAFALVPTVGTAMVIAFATPANLTGRLLGQRLLVGIGLISYSAYLWHQPIFAFARHRMLTELSAPLLLLLATASFALAALSWRYVERPFRDRSRIARRPVLVAAVTVATACFAVGLAGNQFAGDIVAHNAAAAGLAAQAEPRRELLAARKALLERYGVNERRAFTPAPGGRTLVLGDSTSEDLALSLLLTADRFPGRQVVRFRLDTACSDSFLLPPSEEIAHSSACAAQIAQLHEAQALENADDVVLSAHWRLGRANDLPRRALQLAQRLVARGKTVALVGLLVFPEIETLTYAALNRGLTVADANQLALRTLRTSLISDANATLREGAAAEPGIRFLDKLALFCDATACDVFDANYAPVFADDIHVTARGARDFGLRMAEAGWFR